MVGLVTPDVGSALRGGGGPTSGLFARRGHLHVAQWAVSQQIRVVETALGLQHLSKPTAASS
jgi:hypothetical protein